MTETKERKVARKGFIIALGIICVILVACLGGVIAAYTFVLSDKDKTISSLTSQISELSSNVSNIMSDPSAWVNKTVVVEGNISFFMNWLYSVPWNYQLSSNGATIGVSWQGNIEEGVNVLVLGVVTEGEVTIPINGTPTHNVYFIEAERIDKL
jgi:hypothetical protein